MTETPPEPEVAGPPRSGTVRARGRRRERRGEALRVGATFGTALSVWSRNCLVFLLFSAIVFAPYLWFSWWLQHLPPREAVRYARFDPLLVRSLSVIVRATLIAAVVAELRGRREPFGTTMARGFRALPTILALSIVIVLIYLLLALPSLIGILIPFLPLQFLVTIGTLVGVLLVSLMFYVAVPVAVVERAGVIRALERSTRLTRGHRGALFIVVLLFGLAFFAIGKVSDALLDQLDGLEYAWLVDGLTTMVLASVEGVFVAVIYRDLRVAMDGVDTETIAAVFD